MSPRRRRNAFTLIEVLIVVVIMAVLAATIIPQFASSTNDAKESSLSFNLHTMRSQIELYKVHHLAQVPTDVGDATNGFLPQMTKATNAAGNVSSTGVADATHPYGPYFDEVPANPFNDLNSVTEVTITGVGTDGDGSSGWRYNTSTGELWPNNTEWKAPTTP